MCTALCAAREPQRVRGPISDGASCPSGSEHLLWPCPHTSLLSFQVTFIQNLVFCVERVYRVPDFGVWERGSKYNNGSTELHSR